jgi:hypothetical protein
LVHLLVQDSHLVQNRTCQPLLVLSVCLACCYICKLLLLLLAWLNFSVSIQ